MTPEEQNQIVGNLIADHRRASDAYVAGCAQVERWGTALEGFAKALVTDPAAIYGPVMCGLVPLTGSAWRHTDDLPFVNIEFLIQKSEMIRRFRDDRDRLKARLDALGIRL